VIGTDVPGIRKVIRHGENGYLCAKHPAAIREAIHAVLADPALRTHMGRNARGLVVAEFALDRIAQQEFTVYQKVLE